MACLVSRFGGGKVGVSLPSLQVSTFSLSMVDGIRSVHGDDLAFTPRTKSREVHSIVGGNLARRIVLGKTNRTFRNN